MVMMIMLLVPWFRVQELEPHQGIQVRVLLIDRRRKVGLARLQCGAARDGVRVELELQLVECRVPGDGVAQQHELEIVEFEGIGARGREFDLLQARKELGHLVLARELEIGQMVEVLASLEADRLEVGDLLGDRLVHVDRHVGQEAHVVLLQAFDGRRQRLFELEARQPNGLEVQVLVHDADHLWTAVKVANVLARDRMRTRRVGLGRGMRGVERVLEPLAEREGPRLVAEDLDGCRLAAALAEAPHEDLVRRVGATRHRGCDRWQLARGAGGRARGGVGSVGTRRRHVLGRQSIAQFLGAVLDRQIETARAVQEGALVLHHRAIAAIDGTRLVGEAVALEELAERQVVLRVVVDLVQLERDALLGARAAAERVHKVNVLVMVRCHGPLVVDGAESRVLTEAKDRRVVEGLDVGHLGGRVGRRGKVRVHVAFR